MFLSNRFNKRALVAATLMFTALVAVRSDGLGAAGHTLELQVTGRAGVPGDASAVVVNLTATEAQAPGFVTAYPCGQGRPTASVLNYEPGSSIANTTIVDVGVGGKICLYTHTAVHLVVDVQGHFNGGDEYTSRVPERILDTRESGALNRSRSTFELQVTGRAGVPGDASAVVVNLTATEAQAPGFVTAYPCGQGRPTASVLNYEPGSSIANTTIVDVGVGGKICLYTHTAVHLVVDVQGHFNGGDEYTSRVPERILDTRESGALNRSRSTFELQVTGRAGVPGDASAVVVNLTATEAQAPGFVTAYPCGQGRPTASVLNYEPGSSIANTTIVDVGVGGKICLYTHTAVHLVVDVQGHFNGGDEYTSRVPERILDTRESGNGLTVPGGGGGSAPGGGGDDSGGAGGIPTGAFVETFDANGGMDRLVKGVYHRGPDAVPSFSAGTGGQWTGDHDLSCGDPATQRSLGAGNNDPQAVRIANSFYTCRDHMMTSMGDVDGYSIVWFSPDADRDGRPDTFSGARSVSFDVNVTHLGGRKWWEVIIAPADSPTLSCMPGFTPCGLPVDGYAPGAVVAALDNFFSAGVQRDVWGAGNYCGTFAADPTGCGSKPIRRRFVVTDNGNGTITFSMPDIAQSFTYPGQFPSGPWKVMFKDHNYTPDKDGVPVGHTWHWDNIIVK